MRDFNVLGSFQNPIGVFSTSIPQMSDVELAVTFVILLTRSRSTYLVSMITLLPCQHNKSSQTTLIASCFYRYVLHINISDKFNIDLSVTYIDNQLPICYCRFVSHMLFMYNIINIKVCVMLEEKI